MPLGHQLHKILAKNPTFWRLHCPHHQYVTFIINLQNLSLSIVSMEDHFAAEIVRVMIHIVILWNITPCSMVHFRGSIFIQNHYISPAKLHSVIIQKTTVQIFIGLCCLQFWLTMMPSLTYRHLLVSFSLPTYIMQYSSQPSFQLNVKSMISELGCPNHST
jgi:hypothetical protein